MRSFGEILQSHKLERMLLILSWDAFLKKSFAEIVYLQTLL